MAQGPRAEHDAGDADAAAARARTWSAVLLTALVGSFVLYTSLGIRHLTNNAVGDLEFSGWSGPIAEHLVRGERPYVDFVLPIPPGSFALLALVQKLAGRPLLLQELWLNQICNLLMALAGYAIVRPFVSRVNAYLIAFASLVVLLRVPKECAYDHTAELSAWLGIALGGLALGSAGRRRALLWFGAGLASGATFAFKQSTAGGLVVGWLLAFGYLAGVSLVARERAALLALARDAAFVVLGGLAGLALLIALLHLFGSSFGAYYQAVFRDGAPLKGGSIALGAAFVSYVLGSPAYPASLLLTFVAAAILLRMARRPQGLRLERAEGDEALDLRSALVVLLPALVAFGVAALLIARRVPALPDGIAYWTDRLRFVPAFGLYFGVVFFVAQAVPSASDAANPAAVRRGHELNAVTLIALATSLLHNLSSPEFRPFYDNNPIIPLSFLYLFGAFERARLPRAKLVVYVLALGALFSPKLDRILAAHLPTGRMSEWSHLYVNDSAVPIVRAAQRVWELTRETDSVLVLPEDLEIAGLIDRPRPKLSGAVIFVDQYPRRLLDHDLALLEREPPKVVVLRPAEREIWQRVFAIWNSRSAAAALTERFLDDWLPKRYVLDSKFPTRFGDRSAELQIWVRKD